MWYMYTVYLAGKNRKFARKWIKMEKLFQVKQRYSPVVESFA